MYKYIHILNFPTSYIAVILLNFFVGKIHKTVELICNIILQFWILYASHTRVMSMYLIQKLYAFDFKTWVIKSFSRMSAIKILMP